MKDINTIISELVTIGNDYPKKSGFFTNVHTHQALARKLIDLNNINSLDNQEKIYAVISTCDEIYQSMCLTGRLVKAMHNCLMHGEDFQAYTQAIEATKEKIHNDNQRGRKKCGIFSDYQFALNMTNYQDAMFDILPKAHITTVAAPYTTTYYG